MCRREPHGRQATIADLIELFADGEARGTQLVDEPLEVPVVRDDGSRSTSLVKRLQASARLHFDIMVWSSSVDALGCSRRKRDHRIRYPSRINANASASRAAGADARAAWVVASLPRTGLGTFRQELDAMRAGRQSLAQLGRELGPLRSGQDVYDLGSPTRLGVARRSLSHHHRAERGKTISAQRSADELDDGGRPGRRPASSSRNSDADEPRRGHLQVRVPRAVASQAGEVDLRRRHLGRGSPLPIGGLVPRAGSRPRGPGIRADPDPRPSLRWCPSALRRGSRRRRASACLSSASTSASTSGASSSTSGASRARLARLVVLVRSRCEEPLREPALECGVDGPKVAVQVAIAELLDLDRHAMLGPSRLELDASGGRVNVQQIDAPSWAKRAAARTSASAPSSSGPISKRAQFFGQPTDAMKAVAQPSQARYATSESIPRFERDGARADNGDGRRPLRSNAVGAAPLRPRRCRARTGPRGCPAKNSSCASTHPTRRAGAGR